MAHHNPARFQWLKHFIDQPVVHSIFILFAVAGLAACDSSGGAAEEASNSVPTASGVSITPSSAIIGDTLTGNYTYADVNGDSEGTSTFRWLRNGVAITGATAITYTLVAADNLQMITFEVTPVAVAGNSPGAAVVSSGLRNTDCVLGTSTLNNCTLN